MFGNLPTRGEGDRHGMMGEEDKSRHGKCLPALESFLPSNTDMALSNEKPVSFRITSKQLQQLAFHHLQNNVFLVLM